MSNTYKYDSCKVVSRRSRNARIFDVIPELVFPLLFFRKYDKNNESPSVVDVLSDVSLMYPSDLFLDHKYDRKKDYTVDEDSSDV